MNSLSCKHRSHKVLSVILVISLVVGILSLAAVAVTLLLGDADLNGTVSSGDALLTLQHSVGKLVLPFNSQATADVNGDALISSADALLILQFAVGKITEFPHSADQEDLYYAARDRYYNVDGSDFEQKTVTSLDDTEAIIEEFGGTPKEADVEFTEVNGDRLLVYDRIRSEAEQLGTLGKYDNAKKTTGKIVLDETMLEYSMPTDITAYDAVPIEYKLYSLSGAKPIHIGVTAFEDTSRYADDDTAYFDCNLPGKVDVDIKYEGYVNGTKVSSAAPRWKSDFNDTLGTAYPSYEYGDLTYSGEIAASKLTWLKFSFKNTGNTILDSEGNGAFCFFPRLQKKNSSGEYVEVAGIENYMQRLYDYVYPGETGEFWLRFQDGYAGYTPGDYRVVINSQVRNERDSNAWAANYVGGRNVCIDTFDFTVTRTGEITEPNDVVHQNLGTIPRNQWMGVYEEFMSSYHTLNRVSNNADHPTTGTIYVQPASFTKTIVIKLMHAARQASTMVRIPVNVETDSISVNLNEYNNNYRIKDDGTREPLLATQSMVDMRGNAQMGPDSMSTCINDLRNMSEAGINFLTSTCAFSYNPTDFDSFKFMMDAVREMGCFDFAGYISYPSNSDLTISNATYANGGTFEKTMTSWGDSGYNEANAIMAKYSLQRFGDLFWKSNTGAIPLAMEDTWGWMSVDHDWRFGMVKDSAIALFQSWLEKAYGGDIERLNTKYDSSYKSFAEIDPRKDGNYEEGVAAYNFTNTSDGVFQDWNTATADLDIYRTLARVENYQKILSMAGIEGAKIAIRCEGETWLAGGIKSTTSNSHYRQIYFEQRRNAVIPEILAASGLVYGSSNYSGLPLSASETYELTKQSTKTGITMLKLPMIAHTRDCCINTVYGDSKYVTDFNLKSTALKGVCVDTSFALFPYLKAMYEGGGIPGVMWQDYYCDGFVTSTQYKELQFYTSKIKEMLSTDEGKAWATDFEPTDRSFESDIKAARSYDSAYVADAVKYTERFCNFTDSYKAD